MTPVQIRVFPVERAEEFAWIFSHLEHLFPVSFVQGESFPNRGPGIVFQSSDDISGSYPSPCLIFVQSGKRSGPVPQEVRFEDSSLVDGRIRNRVLTEKNLSTLAPLNVQGDVLATVEGKAVWVCKNGSSRLDVVSLPEIVALEKRMLADNIGQHRFYFVLAVIHFIYRVLHGSGWTPPPLRASFVVDDPNLRRETYGFFDIRRIVELAREHNFHLSVATPPVDLTVASSDVVKLYRENVEYISLSIHGNNHRHREFAQRYSDDDARLLICQMLGRVETFEQRTGLNVSRVVVSPNEMCSRQMMRMMQCSDIDAIAASRPMPWLSPDTWTDGIQQKDSLLCSFPAEFTEGFMPVIRRTKITDNLVFRAFLNQPLVFYFHHEDFAVGFERLVAIARVINSLGTVQWTSLAEISRSNYELRAEGDMVIVRPFSRYVVVTPPVEIRRMAVSLPVTVGTAGLSCTMNGKVATLNHDGRSTEHVFIEKGGRVEIRLSSTSPFECGNGRVDQRKLMAWIRRRSTEFRDRALPYFRRSHSS